MKTRTVLFCNKYKKMMIIITMCLLGAAIIYAASDLVGAANSKAQQSALSSTETQIAAFDALPSGESVQKKPNPPAGDWETINQSEKRVKSIDSEYLTLGESAKTAKENQGSLSQEIVTKLNDLTTEYVELQNKMATAWDDMKPKCTTRAKNCRAQASARQSSNAVLIAENRDSKAMDKMKKDEAEVAKSHTEFTNSKEATDIAPEEKTRINDQVVPRIDMSLQKVATLLSEITGLIQEAQSVATGVADAKSNPLGALNAVKKGGGILNELKSLLEIVQGTEKNMNTIKKNAQTLAK